MPEHKALASLTPLPQPAASPQANVADPSDWEGWKKVHRLALRQLNRFMSCEAKVLRGEDTDAIHDMRVASRRLQQMLDLIYPKPRPQELRELRRQIRRCRRVLGDVRNCDVLLQHVDSALGKKRTTRREAWTAVQHYLLMRRSQSYLRALRKFGKINPAVLYVNLKPFLVSNPPAHTAEHHHRGAEAERAAFSKHLAHTLQSVWTAFEEQVTLSYRDTRPGVIHAARIATKRLRYLLEVFCEFKVEGSIAALNWLRQLQQHLGDWHDLEVLEQMMIAMLARPEFLQEQLPLAMDIAKLISRNRRAKAQFESKYFQMSRESAEIHRLKDWVSHLAESPSVALAKTSAAG